MIIVSKDKNNIVNLDHVTNIFVGSDGYTVKAEYVNGSGCQLGRYNSPVANKVIEMIGLAVGKTEVYFLPDDESVSAKINETKQTYHHVTGKKTKGHGGS